MEKKLRYTLSKDERLKSSKDIEALFANAQNVSVFPLKVLYLCHQEESASQLRAGFTVSTRHFKKAVDRNRIKRLLRESYRLQQNSLFNTLLESNSKLNIFFIFSGNEMVEYSFLYEKVGKAIEKIETKIKTAKN